MVSPWLRIFALAIATVPLALSTARADLMVGDTWLTMSNRLAGDGHTFGYLMLMGDNGNPGMHVPEVQPGQMLLSFAASQGPWPYNVYAPGWGIDAVAFNTNLKLSSAQIAVPVGWVLSHNGTMDGFGKFTWVARTTDSQYRKPWTELVVSGLGLQAHYEHFELDSQTGGGATPQIPAFFAAHVSGLTPNSQDNFITEYTFGGGALTAPEPATLVLCVFVVSGVVAGQALRRPGST